MWEDAWTPAVVLPVFAAHFTLGAKMEDEDVIDWDGPSTPTTALNNNKLKTK